MRVAEIVAFPLRLSHHYSVGGHQDAPGRLPGTDYYIEPQWVHAYSRATEACLVKVTADDGSVGWGEIQAPLTPQTPATLIATLLGPALLGLDATAPVPAYHRLQQLMLARGHVGSFLVDAVAGLDMALWDLKARKLGVPLFELLGGAFRTRLPAYVSGLRVKTLEEKVAAARRFVGQGYAGVKIFLGGSLSTVEAEARAVREAVGPDRFFALDAICKYDVAQATRLGRTLDELRADWFEAPLAADDPEGHAALARRIDTPIAVGETLRTARQFEPWLRTQSLAVAQPDVMRCGVTGSMQIAALADAFHVPTALHTGVCTGVGMAATWQVAAALPGNLPQEHQHDLFEAGSRVLKAPLRTDGATLVVPTSPGIGVEVDEVAVRKFATEILVVNANGHQRMEPSR